MPREHRLLAAIHPVFHLAPQPYLLCEDTSVIGVPFYLMERRRGLVIRRQMPREIEDSLTLRHQISEAMVDALAALHAVDIYSSGLANLGKPVGFVTRQVRGWSERWQRSKTSDVPDSAGTLFLATVDYKHFKLLCFVAGSEVFILNGLACGR